MARTFGHEDASTAPHESLQNIVKNHSIGVFLDTDMKRYVVGPKGSGKTLLLLRKAIDQRKAGSGICIPAEPGPPVDRLTAARHIGEEFNRRFSSSVENNLAWTTVWKYAISKSILHHVREEILEESTDRTDNTEKDSWRHTLAMEELQQSRNLINEILQNEALRPRAPFYYYSELANDLDAAPVRTLDKIRKVMNKLDDLLQIYAGDIYVFMDNLDDYYEAHPTLWFCSMYGQLRAIREISMQHRHVHLYTTLRKDVYSQFTDEMQLQFFDHVTHLSYDQSLLMDIFESGVRNLDDDLLMRPSVVKKNPWEAFFGEHTSISNDYVDSEEDIRDYIYRHSLARPRDMIHIGTVLLSKRPTEGFTANSIRGAVSSAERHIASQYLAEVSTQLDKRFNLRTFVEKFVPRNIFSRDELTHSYDEYLTAVPATNGSISREDAEAFAPFATLYDLGLLGVSERKVGTKEHVQKFRSAGQGIGDRRLPKADWYFLHPILNHWLAEIDPSNATVVGYDYPVTGKQP